MRVRNRRQTPASLAVRYEKHARIQRWLVRGLQRMQEILEKSDRGFRSLLADENFLTLLRAEGLDQIPHVLLQRARGCTVPRSVQSEWEGTGAANARSLLESKNVGANTWLMLSRMTPLRQTEAARLMVAVGCYSAIYARALVSASYLSSAEGSRSCARISMHPRKRRAADREITELAGQLNSLSGLDGSDLLALRICRQYARQLLANTLIKRYLGKRWPGICDDLAELAHEPLMDFRPANCGCARRERPKRHRRD